MNYQRKPAFDLSEISGEPKTTISDLFVGVGVIALAVIVLYILLAVEPAMNQLVPL